MSYFAKSTDLLGHALLSISMGCLILITSCQGKFDVQSNQRNRTNDTCENDPKAEGCDSTSKEEISSKLGVDNCIDPDLNLLASSQKITLCDGSEAQGKFDLTNLAAAYIKSGITIAGVTGNAVIESHSSCAADGVTGCVTTASFPSADATYLVASNIKKDITIGGVPGSKREMKQCRNAADLTTFDAAYSSNLPIYDVFGGGGSIIAANDIITFPGWYAHALTTGNAVGPKPGDLAMDFGLHL